MAGAEIIAPELGERPPSSDRVIHLNLETGENIAHAQRHLRLAQLRVTRGESGRLFVTPKYSYREALDTFIWSLPLGCTLTIAYEFGDTGLLTAHAEMTAEARDEQTAAGAADDLVA